MKQQLLPASIPLYVHISVPPITIIYKGKDHIR